MTTEKVKVFKNELRNYNLYKEILKDYNFQLELLYDKLGGSPHSPKLDGEPIHSPKNVDAEYKTRDDIDKMIAKIKVIEDKINEIDKVLATMQMIENDTLKTSTIALEMYAKGISTEKLSKKYNYSATNIKYWVNKDIKKALDKF